MTDFVWTDERIEKLRQLWAEGLSAGQIAARFPGASRNAIIGKAHRLGLSKRAVGKRNDLNLVAPKPATVKPLVGSAQFARKKADPAKMAEVKAIENKPAPAGLPKPLFVKLFELERNDCRWPVTGEKENTLFCGHNVDRGSSYCAGHHRLSIGKGTASERAAVTAKMVA